MKKSDDSGGAVLIVAPLGKDAFLAAQVLERAGITAAICSRLGEVANQLDDSTDAVLVAEEALLASEVPLLLDALGQQPPWSDIPLIILTSSGAGEDVSLRTIDIFGQTANILLLERPLRSVTLLSTLKVALRSRRRQREVRDLLEQRETALTGIGDAFAAVDGEWRYIYVNDRAAEYAAMRRDEMIGRSIWEIFPDEVGGNFHTHALRARDTRQPQSFEQYYERWQCWLETHIYPAGDGVAVFRADINERKEAEEALREKEEFVRLLLDSAADAFYGVDREGATTICNAAFLRMLGFEREEDVIGRKLHDVIHHSHPDGSHYPKEECPIYQTAQTGRSAHIDNELFFRRDGSSFPVEYWSYPIVREGELRGAVTTFIDITERREAERALRASEKQLRFVTDHAETMLLAQCDAQERFLFVNAPYAARYGKTREQLIGHTVRETIGERAYAVMAERVAAVLRGEEIKCEVEMPYDTGARWMNFSLIPDVSVEGQVKSFLAVIQDVTERKKAEIILEKAKRAAEEANRAKDQFLAMLSHELRTPLTPVLMTVAALQRDPVIGDELRGDLELIERNVTLEARLIDDLLDLTRITHGKLELQSDAVDIHGVLDHALSISAADVQDKNLSVSRDYSATEHHSWADAARVQQVFWNLIKNAVKFTPDGGHLSVNTRNDGDWVVIEISDTGIGIDPANISRIFGAFEQVSRTITASYGGLGLGLAISKRVIDQHGGTISASSPGVGAGATFTIKLPVIATSLLEGPIYLLDPKRGSTGCRILLVEDHEDTARVLRRILDSAGHRVTVAGSVETAKAVAASNTFDLVISDLGLPDGSGLDLMRHLREHHTLPGIALSGYGMEEDIGLSKDAGFSEHLTKPVDWDRLREAIDLASDCDGGRVEMSGDAA